MIQLLNFGLGLQSMMMCLSYAVFCAVMIILFSEGNMFSHHFRLKLFGKGVQSGVKCRGPRDLASLERFIAEQLGAEVEVSKGDKSHRHLLSAHWRTFRRIFWPKKIAMHIYWYKIVT